MANFEDFTYRCTLHDWIISHDPLIVVAGHYSLADFMVDVSNSGDAEVTSFKIGVNIVKKARDNGNSSHLILLINDIGVDEERRRMIKTGYKLPENYLVILQEKGLDQNQISIFFESSMRNKASTLLRKLYRKKPHLFERRRSRENDLAQCVDDNNGVASGWQSAYMIKGPKGEKLMVKDGPNPKFNLILATFFRDLRRRFSPELIVNVFNNIYQHRIHLGLHVGRKILDNSTPVLNLFCDGQNFVKNGYYSSAQMIDFGYALN